MKRLISIFFLVPFILPAGGCQIPPKQMALPGDVVFNEIMFDPEPQIGLPPYEYIELYNRSGFQVQMKGWTIQTGSATLELGECMLLPESFLLLCYRGTREDYRGTGPVLDLLASRTMLRNDGSLLKLLDPDSILVDWMEYSPGMHAGEYFQEGGWSLERIDAGRPCHHPGNWTSSVDRKGGTPGRENSAGGPNPDTEPPGILSVYPVAASLLTVEFDASVDRATVLRENTWFVDGGTGHPDSLSLDNPFHRILTLHFAKEFTPGRKHELVLLSGIRDCSGNLLPPGKKFRFALPAEPRPSGVLLSEILFNPWPYCPDFIEVYNPGPETIDLGDLRLDGGSSGGKDRITKEGTSAGTQASDARRIVNGHRLFYPGEFLVLTKSPRELAGFYRVEDLHTLVQTSGMPSMEDVRGTVILADKYLTVVDEFSYHRDMHHPMLASDEGVSLERISFQVPAWVPSNWHSAASSEGYATPGRKNSQSREEGEQKGDFCVEPGIFTPDLDGKDDVLFIRFDFPSPGLRARILVFDPRGRLIREIASRQLLGTRGFFTWDGTDGKGKKARDGMYLILAEVYGAGSRKTIYRKTCVLSTNR